MRINFLSNTKSENGSYLFQYLSTITATFGILSTSMHTAWPAPTLPQLLGNSSDISVTDSEGSWIAVLMLLGCPVGSVITFLVVDILGRKKVILLTAPLLILSWLLLAYGTVIEFIYLARFMAGMADGAVFTAIPMYVCEIADPTIRGTLGSASSVTHMSGILLMNILGICFTMRHVALISLVVPVLFVTTFYWMPESPYFFIMKQREEKAKHSLRILKGRIDVDNDVNRLLKVVKDGGLQKGKLLDLIKVKSNRTATLLVIGLRTIQQLSGITAITFYVQILFENTNSLIPAHILTIIFFSIQCTITITSSLLLDKAGRKPLLIISLVGCTIFLFIQATYNLLQEQYDLSHLNAIPIVSLILFIVCYCLGLATIPILMLGELFPTDVKALGLCVAEIYYGIIATVASKFFQIVKDEFGLFIPFYVFAGFCLLGLIFVVRHIPETKGRTLEEIQEYLRGERSESHGKHVEQC